MNDLNVSSGIGLDNDPMFGLCPLQSGKLG